MKKSLFTPLAIMQQAMKPLVVTLALTSVGLVALATQASATSIVYTTESSFLGAINAGYYLNDFNSITSYGQLKSPSNPALLYSGGSAPFAYSINSTSGWLFGVTPGGNGAMSTGFDVDSLIISFTSGNVTAVGGIFSLTNDPGNLIGGDVTVLLSDSTSQTFAANQFRGFTSGGPLITSLLLSSPSGGDNNHYPTLDHFYAGTASVPDGGTTLVLLGGALTGLAALRRKSRT